VAKELDVNKLLSMRARTVLQQTREQYLAKVRTRLPLAIWMGHPPTAHLDALCAAIRLLWIAQPYRAPLAARLAVTPTQFLTVCSAGSLSPMIARTMSGALTVRPISSNLSIAADEVSEFLALTHPFGPARWQAAFTRANGPLLDVIGMHYYLLRRAVLWMRLGRTGRCQAYEAGVPQEPPRRGKLPADAALILGEELDETIYPGLPFTPEAVAAALPEEARPHVTLEWHERDDILPSPWPSGAALLEWLASLCPEPGAANVVR
jgi:hypothetical protein